MIPATDAPETLERSLPERLEALSRYVRVIAEELEARQRRDAARVSELETRRKELEQQLREAEETPEEQRLEELLHLLLQSGLQEIAKEVEVERRVRDQWARLDDRVCLARRLPRTGAKRGDYLQNGQQETNLDVRL